MVAVAEDLLEAEVAVTVAEVSSGEVKDVCR
jgi:hypothetical protein